MSKAPKKPSPRKVTRATDCDVALREPGVKVSLSYKTPAMKVRGKLISRLKEDGETIVVPMTIAERDERIAAESDVFFVTNLLRLSVRPDLPREGDADRPAGTASRRVADDERRMMDGTVRRRPHCRPPEITRPPESICTELAGRTPRSPATPPATSHPPTAFATPTGPTPCPRGSAPTPTPGTPERPRNSRVKPT